MLGFRTYDSVRLLRELLLALFLKRTVVSVSEYEDCPVHAFSLIDITGGWTDVVLHSESVRGRYGVIRGV